MKNITKIIGVAALAVTMGGCAAVERVGDVGINTATNQASLWENQVNLATYAPTEANKDEVTAICNNIASHKETRNAGWEFVKGAGGLLLRTAGVVATAAGYPIAGAIDLVTDVATETENVVGEVNKANSALIVSNQAKCKKVGVNI